MKFTNIKIVWRRMFKDKVITLINLSGLSLSIACVIILTSWVLYETSYDKHIPDGDMIYRITLEGEINGEFIKSTQTLAGIPPEVKKDFPELDSYVRLVNQFSDCVIQREGQECFRESGFAADSTFFDVFPYKAVYGNLKAALAQLDQIVIDQYLSEICFGDEDPIGQVLSVDDHKFTVAAVMENIPAQSHLKFHFLIPFINAGWMVKNQWGGDNVNTFLKFKHIDNVEFIESKITELVYSHESQWKDLGIVFRLQPLYDIYLSDYKYDYAAEKGSKKNILIFSITAFLVLLIACINFTNLFIASSLKRKRAMGIMLVNGAQRTHLLRESFLEVFLFLLLSFFVAIVLVKTIEPFFMALAGKEIVIQILSFQFLALSVPIILVSLVLTSLFPWIYFRGLSLVSILKEGRSGGPGKFNIQKILVTTQFVIAIILIFNVLTVSKQLAFLQDKQLGFEKENVVYVYTTGKLQKKYIQKRMKNELLQNPSILGVATRSSLPTIWNNGNPLSNKAEYKEVMPTEEILVDEDYFDLMHINFIEGENIFKQKNWGKDFCIINQMAAEKLGLEAPFIDKVIYQGPNRQLIVKGVTENVNTKSLMQMVDPCVYRASQNKGKNGIILIKITDNYEEAIKAIKRFCTATNPNSPFEYHFLDEVYDELYASETTSRSIMLVFALLAIIIISLGLLAMVLFITDSRIKEIGIRKVNGATISEILLMLNKDFIKWVAIAFVIAVPIAYYAMHKWLENFAYKTELTWWIFALAGVLALGIALLTVSWQSYRAARCNPIESLRYE